MKIGNINLEWLGHAGFLLSNGKRIYIDPYQLSGEVEKADIVLITHSHYDHCSIEDLQKIVKDESFIFCPADCQSKLTKLDKKINIQVIEPGQEKDVEGVKIKAVASYNVDKQFHAQGEGWLGYVVEIEGKKIYHAGDTDLIPEMSNLRGLSIDVALLPVGGTYTMNAEEAAKAAGVIKPKLAVPMHYGSVAGSGADAERFVDLCKKQRIEADVLEKK